MTEPILNHIYTGDALTILRTWPDSFIQCVVTSPPYWGLRDYGVDGQLGLEPTPEEYVAKMTEVFREVRRTLKPDGTLWLNIGDSYLNCKGMIGENGAEYLNRRTTATINSAAQCIGGKGILLPKDRRHPIIKRKELVGIPWLVAFALRADGWYLRSDIIWAKPNGMPESVEDRPTRSHEYLFLLTKSAKYYSDFDAIKTPARESSLIRTAQDLQLQAGSHRANGGEKVNGPMKAVGCQMKELPDGQANLRKARDKQRGHSRRHARFNDRWDNMTMAEQQSKPCNIRDVWFVPPECFKDAHFAVMPEELARRCILAGSRQGDIVLDPFMGSGTSDVVARKRLRRYLGIELNPLYVKLAQKRLDGLGML